MIHHGDLFDVLPTLPEASIDACVCDPPYGLEFMGKDWDKLGGVVERNDHESDPFAVQRGGSMPFGGAGQRVRYGRAAKSAQEWHERWAREVFRVLKPGAHLLAFGGTRTFHRMTCAVEDAGFEIRDCLSWLYGSGFPKSLNLPEGRGTALKPAWEPIVLARKPMRQTVAANVSQHGTGAINVDVSRIGFVNEEDKAAAAAAAAAQRTSHVGLNDPSTFQRTGDVGASIAGYIDRMDLGRWPANVVLDEAAAVLLDEQSGELVSGANPTRRGMDGQRDVFGAFAGQAECEAARGLDIGGASRFFYVAKPSREERDMGCEFLLSKPRDEGRKDGNPGGDNPRNRGLQRRGNHHPTVKPVELMRWLVRLVTPINGIVLDPFMGSGTTGMACAYEARPFVGIEREVEYVEIATRRIASCLPLFTELVG